MAKKKVNGAGKGALVYLVLDKSGSMMPIQRATIDGVNHFVAETAKADPTALFHQMQFDTSTRKVHSGVVINDVSGLDGQTYRPGGGTALLDAVGRAVKEVDDMPEKPSKVVIVILTDGQENESHEYTRAAVQALISKHESEDGWQFLFLGAGVNAFAEAGAIGMAHAASSSATWQPTASGTQAAYMAVSTSTSNYLRGFTSGASLTQDSYDQTLASLTKDESAESDAQTVDVTPTKPVRSKR